MTDQLVYDLLEKQTTRITTLERLVEKLTCSEYAAGLEGPAGPAGPAGSGGWELINETILAQAVASITFADIPQTYRSLILIAQARCSIASELEGLGWQVNADSGANYDYIILYSYGGTTNTAYSAAYRAQTAAFIGCCEGDASRANNFTPAKVQWDGYALADREKWAVAHTAVFGNVSTNNDMYQNFTTSRWRNTTAITDLTVLAWGANDFMIGSRFALYGVT